MKERKEEGKEKRPSFFSLHPLLLKSLKYVKNGREIEGEKDGRKGNRPPFSSSSLPSPSFILLKSLDREHELNSRAGGATQNSQIRSKNLTFWNIEVRRKCRLWTPRRGNVRKSSA